MLGGQDVLAHEGLRVGAGHDVPAGEGLRTGSEHDMSAHEGLRTRGRRDVVACEGLPPERVALVDLLDRLLAGGVVVTGDLVLSIADIDLVKISLRTLIVSVDELEGNH